VSGAQHGDPIWRGIALFLVVVAAVTVREAARLIMAAWLGLRLRAVLLLPIGGLFAYADPESQENAGRGSAQFFLAFTGPLANTATALVLAAMFLGAGGNMHLLDPPLITSVYLLRSLVWMQVGLALIHLVPAYPLDFGRLLRAALPASTGSLPPGARRPASGRFWLSQPWWAACCCTITGSLSPVFSS